MTFGGPAPSGTGLTSTVTLDGSRHGFLTTDTPAVDSGKTFAVGAWVRPARDDRSMTVLSQDTASGAAYALALEAPRKTSASYSFTLGDTKITGGTPEAGEWAYLLGLYDTETGHAQLFVNGHEVGTKAEAAPVRADGAFQIGRVLGPDGYRQHWHGDIGDVRAYDRLVVPSEVTGLAHRKPTLLGHWSFSTADDGTTPENAGGAPCGSRRVPRSTVGRTAAAPTPTPTARRSRIRWSGKGTCNWTAKAVTRPSTLPSSTPVTASPSESSCGSGRRTPPVP